MKIYAKILLIILIGVVSISKAVSQNDTLYIVKAVVIDANKNGIVDGLEVQFNQAVDFSESNDEDDDWILSNYYDMSDSVVASDVTSTVEYIAQETGADDEYLRIEFLNDPSDFLAKNNSSAYYFQYIQTNGPTDAVTSNEATADEDTLKTMPFGVLAEDYAPPVINSIELTEYATGTKFQIDDSIKFKVNLFTPELGVTIIPSKYNGQNLNWSTDDDSTFIGTYVVKEGGTDQPTDLDFSNVGARDVYGNISEDLKTFDVTKGIDANRPEIKSVLFTPGNGSIVGKDEIVRIDITLINPEAGLDTSTFQINNQGIELLPNGGNYYGIYTVSENDDPIDDAALLPFAISLSDGIYTTDTLTEADLTSDYTPGVDPSVPSISSVTFNPGDGETVGVGDTIYMTINASEEHLSFTSLTVNSKNIAYTVTDSSAGLYGAYYVVKENDFQFSDGTKMAFSITISDGANDVSYDENDFPDNAPGIDSKTPKILSVELKDDSKYIGEEDTLYINITPDANYTQYTLVSGNIGGFNIKGLDFDSGTVLALFDITEKNYEIDSAETVYVNNLILQDAAGNQSNIINQNVNNDNHAIFSKKPTASISGSGDVCDGDTIYTTVFLDGHEPYSITYTDGVNAPYIVSDIYESYYTLMVKYGAAGLNYSFSITNVTDATGNSNTGNGTYSLDVNEIPYVEIISPGDGEDIDVSSPSENLQGNQPDGIFSGEGVISYQKLFIPEIVGANNSADIYFSYTDENGCSNSDTITVDVIDGGGINFDPDKTIFCSTIDTFNVYGYNNLAVTGSFVIEGNPNLLAIEDLGDNTALIFPSKLDPGSYNIIYSYPGGQDIIKGFTVESVETPSFTTIGSLCADYETLDIKAGDLNPLGGTGYFSLSDPGVDLHITNKGNNISINSGDLTPDGLNPRAYRLEYYYVSQNLCTSETIHEDFVVNPLPVVDLTMEPLYDKNGGTRLILGNPQVPAGEFSPSFMIDQNNGSAIFDPEIAGIGDKKAYYTYTDLNGCVNTDSAEFTITESDAEFFGLDEFDGNYQYCYYNSAQDTIWAKAYNGDGSAGTISIDGVVIPNVLGKDSVFIIPSNYSAGDHTLGFSYKNGSVQFYIEETINIDSIGYLNFTGLAPEYCEDNDTEIDLTEELDNQGVGVIEYSGNGIIDPSGVFKATEAQLGINTITLKFTRSASGCYKEYNKNVTINKQPFVDFNFSNLCLADRYDLVQLTSDTLGTDNVTEWFYRVNNSETLAESTEDSSYFSLLPQKINYVKLTLTTDKGCAASKDSSTFIGSVVDIDFDWDNECDGETVTFEVLEFTDPLGIDSITWDFGGSGNLILMDPEKHNPQYLYDSVGGFNVTYTEYTKTCGPNSETKKIYMRPTVTIVGEYFEDFEQVPDSTGWAVDIIESSTNYTWEWGEPNGTKIIEAASGTGAFVTNLMGDYANNEKSYVSSPCFDFSALEKPMMRFDFISALELSRDGVILQYSVQKDVWNSVGVYGEGVNWYNSFGLNSNIMGQSSGWNANGITLNASDPSTWNNAKYWLDEVAGESGVRLRFMLGTDSYNTNEGFGFDNVWIGERNRLVLLEHFANPENEDFNSIQNLISTIVNDNSRDVIPIQFFTSFPETNEISNFYTAGPSARSLYYGISQSPYSVVDGGDRKFSYSSTNELEATDIKKRMLEESIFEIGVFQDVDAGRLNIQASVKALEQIDITKFSVRLAVVEKSVESYKNPSDLYINVIRTILPDPGGNIVQQSWEVDDSVNLYHSWDIPAGVIADSLMTVVIIQNENTKEVYQSAYTDEFTTITAIDDLIKEPVVNDYMVYPNPVAEAFTIKIMNIEYNDIQVQIFNNAGILVKNDMIYAGEDYKNIYVNDLPQGIYYIKLEGSKSYSVKKIIKN